MEQPIVSEAADILKRLSPNNQEYFMTMVRVAETAENSVKNLVDQSRRAVHNTSQLPITFYKRS